MDVRAFGSWMSTPKCLFFPGFRGPDRSFCPRTSAGISAGASAGYPAPKLTLWAAVSPCFFRFAIFLAFWCVFALFSKDFRGSAGKEILVFFFRGILACLDKKKTKDRRVRGNNKSQFLCPLTPPPAKQQSDAFPLEFLLKGPQTKLRTLSQNYEQTLQKLRTNRITNKLAFLIFAGKSYGPEGRTFMKKGPSSLRKRSISEPSPWCFAIAVANFLRTVVS